MVLGGLAHQPVARGVEVARHLQGEPAAVGQGPDPGVEQVEVPRHPLQGRVGHDDVGGLAERGGVPLAQVGLHPLDPLGGVELAGRLEHRLRGVDPDDARLRPELGEGQRRRAVAAAEVDDQRGSSVRTCATRSANGRLRSPANLPYAVGSQSRVLRAMSVVSGRSGLSRRQET